MAQIITQNWWGWGSWGSYTAWCWIDITCWEISVDTSVIAQTCDLNSYQTKSCMVCSLTGADNDHYPSAKAVADAISCSGGWDVMWPSCSTDGNVVLFDWATGKCIKDSWVSLSSKQDALTAWANIDLTCAKVSATNTYIVTESNSCTTYTWEKWVAPYNTSYCYTNICINPASWIKWQEWSIYTFDINTQMLATSACRNVRVKIGDGDYIPVMWTSAVLAWCSYFTKANIRQYQYSTKYQACWALHLFTDSNTTYTAMTTTEATTGTCACGRVVPACVLKCAINYFAPISDTAYWSSWDWKTTTAPSQNAVYDKIEAVVCAIPTDNCQLANWCGYTTCTWTISNCAGIISALWYTPYNCTNPAWYTTCTWTLVASDLNCYAKCCDIPTDNCQLANSCGYTTCTGTISNCAGIVSALGYTPYSNANPNGYTTCTGTLTSWDLKTVNCCSLVWSWNIQIDWAFDSTPYLQCEYDALPASKNTDCIRRLIYE